LIELWSILVGTRLLEPAEPAVLAAALPAVQLPPDLVSGRHIDVGINI
jgi:hypothetical protein